ncbi:MAG: hypothetical protein P8Y38_11660 [Deltaproteobacteria bacterium]
MENASNNGSGYAVGGSLTDFVDGLGLGTCEKALHFNKFFPARCHTENRIAVKHGMGRPHASGHAVLSHLGHFLSLCFAKDCIGRHHADGSVSHGDRFTIRRDSHFSFP